MHRRQLQQYTQLSTVHTRHLQQYTQDYYNNTHKIANNITHETTNNNTHKTPTTIHKDNYNNTHKTTTTIHTTNNSTHKTTTTIHTRQLQQYTQDNYNTSSQQSGKICKKGAIILQRGKRSEQHYEESVPNLITNHVVRIKRHSVQCVVRNGHQISYVIRKRNVQKCAMCWHWVCAGRAHRNV
jgi:hypothetical protein